MSLNKEDAQKDLHQSEVDLDTLLTSFLDKEIGMPAEKNELAPDLDLKLKEALREIGLVNAPPTSARGRGEDHFPASSREHAPPVPSGTEAHPREEHAVQPDLTLSSESSAEQCSAATTSDPVSYLADAIQVALVPQKTLDSNRKRSLAAGAVAVLVIMGIAGYFWYRPGTMVRPAGPTPITESTPSSADKSKVSSLAPSALEPSQMASPASPTGKAESRVIDGATAKEGLPQKNILTSSQEVLSSGPASTPGGPSPGNSGNRPTDSQTAPSHSAPPTSPLDLKPSVPELPPPEGNASISIKDIALPRPSVNSAVQPQIALPSATPVEPTGAGVSTPAVALNRIRVIYPEIAKRTRAKGRVDVEFSVDQRGKVVQANAKSGPLVLRKAAEDAIYRTRFKPAVSNGMNIPARGKITLVFDLDNP
jgi:TonB family protein